MTSLALLATLLGAGIPHPLHTSTLTIRPAGAGIVAVELRAFADDFPRPHTAAAIGEYVNRQVIVVDRRGTRHPLRLESHRTEAGMLILAFQVATTDRVAGWRIANRLLTEVFPDQLNVIRVIGPGGEVALTSVDRNVILPPR